LHKGIKGRQRKPHENHYMRWALVEYLTPVQNVGRSPGNGGRYGWNMVGEVRITFCHRLVDLKFHFETT